MFRVPNALRRLEEDDVLRAVGPMAGREGLRVTLDLGLDGGLYCLQSPEGRREGVSSAIVLLLGLV